MKLAASPCSFTFYNKDNPIGKDDKKYYVSAFSFSGETGETSNIVSGELYIDQITVNASLTVTSLLGEYFGSASFVFPARHWALMLDGHATLAEQDTVTKTVELMGSIGGIPTPGSFAITAEISESGQSVWEDWSPT
jgi:hypothetical protein